MHSIGYRPEIDGLRAVAVAAVVLFHLGVLWLSGGYLGVDVFFVLSGFLLTSIILREEEEGTFSFVRFWVRRIRRILPALLVVLLVTSLVSAAVCYKPITLHYGEQGAAAALSCANILLWQQVADYWAAAAQRTPFLHTWSLSVEEQFYLVHPLLVSGVLRFGRRYLVATLAAVAIGSFMVSLPGSGWTPSAIFYLLPARAWELALGAFLAAAGSSCRWKRRGFPRSAGIASSDVALLSQPASPLADWSARLMSAGTLLGLVLVVGSFFAVSGKKNFSGYLAVPTLGTALLLACSSGRRDLVTRFLGLSGLVALGRLSYSLYLWHWPVIVLGEHLGMQSNSLIHGVCMLAVMLLLAFVSYRFIETPVRYQLSTASALWLITILLVASLGASAFLHLRPKTYDISAFSKPVFRGKYYDVNPNLDGNAARRKAGSDPRLSYQLEKTFATGGIVRRYGETDPRIVVLGDSHATMWSEVIDTIARDLGVGVCFYPSAGTDPFLSVPPEATRRTSEKMTRAELLAYDQARLDALEHWKPKVVVLGARWDKSYLKIDYVDDLIEACGRVGATVLLVEQPPRPNYVNYEAAPYLSYLGMRPKEGTLQSLPDLNEPGYRKGRELLAKLVKRYPFCRIVPVAELFYSPEREVWVLEEKDVLYWDDDHVSQAGAERAGGLIREAISAALQ